MRKKGMLSIIVIVLMITSYILFPRITSLFSNESLLCTNLQKEDLIKIQTILKEKNFEYKVKGNSIYVNKDKVKEIRSNMPLELSNSCESQNVKTLSEVNNQITILNELKNYPKDNNNLFELNLYSDKQTYKTTDKIKIWATLKYIGSDNQIKIWHSNPYISFSITDGKNFKTGDIFDDLLASTILVKDKLYKFDYAKSGGYSADDPNADYWEKFYKEKDLYLPKGEYTVSVGGAFSLTQNFEKNNLVKETKIKVED